MTLTAVHFHDKPAPDASAERRAALARIETFHNGRVNMLNSTTPQVPVLDGAKLLMHAIPLRTSDDGQPYDAFAQLCANPERFPPFKTTRPRDYKISFDGLVTGSNNEGLGKPQCAYVYVFRSGAVEAVASNLARGQSQDMLELPYIQCMIIHYARVYTTVLETSGIQPPFAIAVESNRCEEYAAPSGLYRKSLRGRLPVWPIRTGCFVFWQCGFRASADRRQSQRKKDSFLSLATLRMQLTSQRLPISTQMAITRLRWPIRPGDSPRRPRERRPNPYGPPGAETFIANSGSGINVGDPALGCSGRYGNQGTGTKNRPPTVLSALFSLLNATSRNAISSWPATVCRQNQVSTWRLDGAAPAA